MELIDFLRTEVEEGQRMLDIALNDLNDDVANYQPGGTANSIGQILAHVVTGQDRAVNVVMRDMPSVLERNAWQQATGIPAERGKIWEKGWRLKVDGFLDYRQAVKASIQDYLGVVDLNDFEREVPWAGRQVQGWWLARTIFINHILGHAGEISALKGIQGLKGLPI